VERHTSTAIHPRAGHFQLRTVEILRAAGLEEAVRRKGEEQYHPNGGINNVESLAGREIASYFSNLNAGVDEFSPTRVSPRSGGDAPSSVELFGVAGGGGTSARAWITSPHSMLR
jgi:FAD binding domain